MALKTKTYSNLTVCPIITKGDIQQESETEIKCAHSSFLALEPEFNTFFLTFGDCGDKVNTAVQTVKIWGGTTLDSVLQLFQEITADKEITECRSGQIVVKRTLIQQNVSNRRKNPEINTVSGSCKIEVSLDSDTDYTCIHIKVYWQFSISFHARFM